MKIIYFAQIRSLIGVEKEEIFIQKKISVLDVIKILKKRNNSYKIAFKELKNIKCSVNCELVNHNKIVKNDDEVAFFPPVTGG